jgi:hypothetical protein
MGHRQPTCRYLYDVPLEEHDVLGRLDVVSVMLKEYLLIHLRMMTESRSRFDGEVTLFPSGIIHLGIVK